MTPLAIRPIERCRVSRNAVLQFSISAILCNKWQGESYIPDNYSPRCPFDSDLKVLAEGDMVVKKFQEKIALFLFVSDDVASDCRIGKS